MRSLNGLGDILSSVIPLSYTDTCAHATSQSAKDEYTPCPLPGSLQLP